MRKLKYLVLISLLYTIGTPLKCNGEELSNKNSTILKGIITNKKYTPLKLKVFQIDKESIFFIERNLEDNSFVPKKNLQIIASVTSNGSYILNNKEINIPNSTKLIGYINEIESPKSFNRKGFFNVIFNKAICPDGHSIDLEHTINSKSLFKTYRPIDHVGKTAVSFLGGSIAGTLLSFQLSGLGGLVATNGYSLAIGAGTGGFIGIINGIISKGETATIEPGSELILAPVDDISLKKLTQIQCNNHLQENIFSSNNNDLTLNVLFIKEKKDILGDTLLMINIQFTNNTDKVYKLNNFFLRDSQGREYTPSILNLKDELFTNFPPNKTINTMLEFFVIYPNTSHWLVLKDNKFTNEIGKWKIKE